MKIVHTRIVGYKVKPDRQGYQTDLNLRLKCILQNRLDLKIKDFLYYFGSVKRNDLIEKIMCKRRDASAQTKSKRHDVFWKN